jgi:glutaconyl-CoA/methylmalonyl-CoA decarboxylase subunit gamma
MSYIVTYRGEDRRASVEESRPGIYKVILGGNPHEVDFLEERQGFYSLIIEGRSYAVDVDGSKDGDTIGISIHGNRFEVEVVEEKKKKLSPAVSSSLSGRQQIKSPMAGNVKKVLVREGDQVEAGHVLLILEAMKMENQVKSPVSGTVTSISASEGIPVAPGDRLCVVEPSSH